MSNTSIGRQGEAIAKQFLEAHDYVIREQNWRCTHGEIDLIVQRQDTIIFVEVKARTTSDFGKPEEAVTLAKQGKLLELAQFYMAEHDLHDVLWHIDVIAIHMTKGGKTRRIVHYKNAIQAGW